MHGTTGRRRWAACCWLCAAFTASEARAWREDPRAAADLPVEISPLDSRRPSRRALRRAARRAAPTQRPAEPRVIPAPLTADTTLDSPFRPTAAERPVVHSDQLYGTSADPRRQFDIHLPPGCQDGGRPLVIWIPGDDWLGGPKAPCPLAWLVDHGYAVASVGYRPSDAAVFPAQLDDCRAATATILDDAAIWGIDPTRVCLVGTGGGGHLATLVGLCDADGSSPVDVAAICAVAAPTHLPSLGPQHDRGTSAASRLVGGPLPEIREAALAASPLVHVTADDPPALLLHGAADDVVPVDQAVRLQRALAGVGVDAKLVILEAGHSLPLDSSSPAGGEILRFLDRAIGPRAPAPPAR